MANLNVDKNWWNSMPEFELEGQWGGEIIDGSSIISSGGKYNSIGVKNYFSSYGIDSYLQNVSIPQVTFNYDSTDYGMLSFKNKDAYDDVTLTCYDDLKGTCKAFFTDWFHCIFDEVRHVLKYKWRYETKDIKVYYYRIINENKVAVTSSYLMKNCLPKSISEISAEEDGGDRKTFSVVLTCQKVYDTFSQTKKSEGVQMSKPNLHTGDNGMEFIKYYRDGQVVSKKN